LSNKLFETINYYLSEEILINDENDKFGLLARSENFGTYSLKNRSTKKYFSFGYLEEEDDEDEYYTYDKLDEKKNDNLKHHYENAESDEQEIEPNDPDDEEINKWQPNVKSKVYLVIQNNS
jgi:hypothetical protein